MSDIFISYANEDRELAKILAHALESQGWSVWWDYKIPFGNAYDDVIAENLAAAHCVIVIWTHNSAGSRWVRTEASEADERNVLIPIVIDAGTKIPLQFKRLQTANLVGWEPGDITHPEFERLLARINELRTISQPEPDAEPNQPDNPVIIPVTVEPDSGEKSQSRKKALLIFGIIVSLSLLAGGITYIMMNWRVPTHIQADLVVDRVALAFDDVTTLSRVDFASATFEHFSHFSFSPKTLEVIATISSKNKQDRANFIENLQTNGHVILLGEKNSSSVISIDNLAEENQKIGSLESIRIEPGTSVTFDASHSSLPSFTLLFTGAGFELAPNVMPAGPFKLTAENVFNSQGVPVKFNKAQYFDLQVELSNDNPFVKLASEANTFTVTLTLADNPPDDSLVKRGSSVSKIELLKQGSMGEFESTLIQTGKLIYADFANIAPVIVDTHHFLAFDDLTSVTIQELRFEPQHNSFVLRFAGEANKIVSRSGELTKDHRLTVFDKLWHDQKLAILLSIVIWAGSAMLGAFKIYQEIRKRHD